MLYWFFNPASERHALGGGFPLGVKHGDLLARRQGPRDDDAVADIDRDDWEPGAREDGLGFGNFRNARITGIEDKSSGPASGRVRDHVYDGESGAGRGKDHRFPTLPACDGDMGRQRGFTASTFLAEKCNGAHRIPLNAWIHEGLDARILGCANVTFFMGQGQMIFGGQALVNG